MVNFAAVHDRLDRLEAGETAVRAAVAELDDKLGRLFGDLEIRLANLEAAQLGGPVKVEGWEIHQATLAEIEALRKERDEAKEALDALHAEAGDWKLPMLRKDRDEWRARAEKAEAEVDKWKERAEKAERRAAPWRDSAKDVALIELREHCLGAELVTVASVPDWWSEMKRLAKAASR